MTVMFNKLFTSILDSSIWLEPTSTRIVWITLLAAMDEDGYAHFSAIENLANRARVSIEEVNNAVECFLSPDPNSSDPGNGGRRVERVPGGFIILNASTHRQKINRAIVREQTRQRVARFRERQNTVTEPLPIVTPASASASECASEEGSGEKQSKRFIPPTIEEVKLLAAKSGLPDLEAMKFFSYYDSKGWQVGRSPMKKWQSALVGWKLKWEESTRPEGAAPHISKSMTLEERRLNGIRMAREAQG